MPIERIRPEKIRASNAKEISVLAWITDAYGQVLMIQQTAGRKLWSLPGGKVRAREPIHRALRRELKEEIGVAVATARIIDIFDRPQKSALAILFLVSLRRGTFKLQKKEIRHLAFLGKLPSGATPSARHFWRSQLPGLKARRARPSPLD